MQSLSANISHEQQGEFMITGLFETMHNSSCQARELKVSDWAGMTEFPS